MASYTLRVNGKTATRSWADDPILRFGEVPAVEVVLLNAVANATGKRLRALPFTPERVKQALA